jgi:hypothetical protein
MWIFTETGFVSAVRKPEYPDFITVRARDRESLESVAKIAKVDIKKSPFGDYTYRVFVTPEAFKEWFADSVANLTYDNFKDQVKQTRGSKFAQSLSQVWLTMLAVEDEEARTPELDSQGKPIRHSSQDPSQVNFEDLTEEQQLALEEQMKDLITDPVIDNWSEEESEM